MECRVWIVKCGSGVESVECKSVECGVCGV